MMARFSMMSMIAASFLSAGLLLGCASDGETEADAQAASAEATSAAEDAMKASNDTTEAMDASSEAMTATDDAMKASEEAMKAAEAAAETSAESMETAIEEVRFVKVQMDTSFGAITLELDEEAAPVSVANFLAYVDDGTYNGTIFHRVIDGFMIQGGGFEPDLDRRPSRAPIANEWQNGLTNERGTVAMARTNDPNSATNQFFINVGDNGHLSQPSSGGAGYAVFGKVIDGMDVVDAIRQTPTGIQGGMQDVPLEPVVINSVSRVD